MSYLWYVSMINTKYLSALSGTISIFVEGVYNYLYSTVTHMYYIQPS